MISLDINIILISTLSARASLKSR